MAKAITIPAFSLLPFPSITARSCPECQRPFRRKFSSTAVRPVTRMRTDFYAWLKTRAVNFETPLEGKTNYLTNYTNQGVRIEDGDGGTGRQQDETPEQKKLHRPFPLNQHFYSQPILSPELRNEVWRRVRVDGKSLRAVSVELKIDMRRVAAVVRLVEIEKQWIAEKKPLALPYARAIHSMVPSTPLTRPAQPHESINDLPVHVLTGPQIFHPTSESRAFNRIDAGRIFSSAPRLADPPPSPAEAWSDRTPELVTPGLTPVLKPADARIPHPHLIAYEQDKAADMPTGEREARYQARLDEEAQQRQKEIEARARREEAKLTRVTKGRWEFRVKDVQTTRLGTGLDGRGTGSPGERYGVPSQDRKRGHVKIPTKVEV